MEDTKPQEFRIDKVLSTQQEIGPVVPDGGYGWIILLGSVFYYISIPSISISYGIFIMYSTLETMDHIKIQFWDNHMINAPLYFIIFWTMVDPISNKIVTNSKWPRLVILSAICLVCSGILCFWLATINSHYFTKFIYKAGGMLTGCGTSLILSQIDVIIFQYFNLKLYKVRSVLIIFRMLGFIVLPEILVKYVDSRGLTHVIGWYHLFLIFGTVLCFIFKKPDYLKNRNYRSLRVQNNGDDEEDIFTKSSTELRITRSSNTTNNPESEASTSGTSPRIIINDNEIKTEWVTFEDEEDSQRDELETPKELFSDLQINNNITYSFDNSDIHLPTENQDVNIFIPPPKDDISKFGFLKFPNFYLGTLQLFVNKSSEFTFYTIYPSYLYYSNQGLHKIEVGNILVYVFVGALLSLIFLRVKDFKQRHYKILITSFSWMTCFGFYLCTDLDLIQWKFFGGILGASGLVSLIYVSQTCYEINSKNQQDHRFIMMYFIAGLSLCAFMITDFTYRNCLRGIGLLQFSNGSIWFCVYIFEKIKSIP